MPHGGPPGKASLRPNVLLRAIGYGPPGVDACCVTCNANWTRGRWTWGCEECGGGALVMPCGLCLGQCEGRFERAVMDSNDSHRAHFLGGCLWAGSFTDKATRWLQLETAAKLSPVPLTTLKAELQAWSSDAAWAAGPRGPALLQVLMDSLLEQGFVVAGRALAHSAFFWRAA
jgi:hypothetical protein